MGSKRLASLADFLRHHYRLRADCPKCKRVAILEPLELLKTCKARRWSYAIGQIERRLVCLECGSKRVRLGPPFGD
jgi:hypothetical protein